MKLYVCCLNLLMALMILPGTASATTMIEESPMQLMARTEYVVSASVIDITSRLEDNKPFEYITLKVTEIHKQDGELEIFENDELTVRLMGGEVDGKRLELEGRPEFVQDEDVFVALSLGEDGNFIVTGNVQGLYHVAGDKLVNDTAETSAMFVRKGKEGRVEFTVPRSEQKTMKEMKNMIKKIAEER